MEAKTSTLIAAPIAPNAIIFFNSLSFSLYSLMNGQRGTFRKNFSDPLLIVALMESPKACSLSIAKITDISKNLMRCRCARHRTLPFRAHRGGAPRRPDALVLLPQGETTPGIPPTSWGFEGGGRRDDREEDLPADIYIRASCSGKSFSSRWR